MKNKKHGLFKCRAPALLMALLLFAGVVCPSFASTADEAEPYIISTSFPAVEGASEEDGGGAGPDEAGSAPDDAGIMPLDLGDGDGGFPGGGGGSGTFVEGYGSRAASFVRFSIVRLKVNDNDASGMADWEDWTSGDYTVMGSVDLGVEGSVQGRTGTSSYSTIRNRVSSWWNTNAVGYTVSAAKGTSVSARRTAISNYVSSAISGQGAWKDHCVLWSDFKAEYSKYNSYGWPSSLPTFYAADGDNPDNMLLQLLSKDGTADSDIARTPNGFFRALLDECGVDYDDFFAYDDGYSYRVVCEPGVVLCVGSDTSNYSAFTLRDLAAYLLVAESTSTGESKNYPTDSPLTQSYWNNASYLSNGLCIASNQFYSYTADSTSYKRVAISTENAMFVPPTSDLAAKARSAFLKFWVFGMGTTSIPYDPGKITDTYYGFGLSIVSPFEFLGEITPANGYIELTKASGDTSLTSGNSNYSLSGAKYGVYSNSSCSKLVTTLTTDSKGYAKSGELPLGTYYVKETTAPNGYQLDTTVYKVVVTAGATVAVKSTDPPSSGYIELKKSSSNPDITDGNSCYSLAGAKYGVYSDSACTKLVTTLTTDSKGYAKSGALALGTYYVKETTAPKGYQLDETVTKVTISSNKQVVTVKAVDDPANDPIGITLTKIQETENTYLPSLAGAQFTVKYYDGYYSKVSDLPAEATRTWVIEVKEVTLSNGKTLYMAVLDPTYKISGDEVYYDDGIATVPLGTITIEETKPAEGYTTEGSYFNDSTGKTVSDSNGMILLQILSDDSLNSGAYLNGGNYYTKEESFQLCSLTIHKQDSSGTAIKGAEFQLEIKNPSTGAWDALTTATSNAKGEAVFDDLVFGKYRVTELSTGTGYSLLAEPFEVELPGDGSNYDVSVTVVNTSVITLPHAGGIGSVPFLVIGVLDVALAAAYIGICRRAKRAEAA